MGSAFQGPETCTYVEAARRLSVSRRTVFNYVKQGFIKKVQRDGETHLSREDVEQVALDQGTDAPAMNRKSFIQMAHRLQKLENEMVTVKHILEIRDSPLRFETDLEGSGLYRAAADALAAGNWGEQEVDLWSGLLERMDEVFFEHLQRATCESKCWVVFLKLCNALQEHALITANKTPSLDWQARVKRLDEGRKKIRGSIILFVEMGKGTTPLDLLSSVDDPKTGFLKRFSPLPTANPQPSVE